MWSFTKVVPVVILALALVLYGLPTRFSPLSQLYGADSGATQMEVTRDSNPHSDVNLTGRVALVVGGTSGIGKGIARALMLQNCTVYVAGRKMERGKEAVEYFKAEMKYSSHKNVPVPVFIPVDFSVLSQVVEFCEDFAELEQRLDYMIAGHITLTKDRKVTRDGLELKSALHYYSRFLAIHTLLPLLTKTQKAGNDVRVMSVLGAGLGTYVPYEDLGLEDSYSVLRAANTWVLYGDLMVDYYSSQNPNISFIHTEPGAYFRTTLAYLMSWVGTSLEQSGQLHTSALLDDSFGVDGNLPLQNGNGFHLMNNHGGHAHTAKPHTPEAVKTVIRHTLKVLDLENSEDA